MTRLAYPRLASTILSTLLLPAAAWSRPVQRSSEETVTTTRTVTAPDGTTTVIEEVRQTKDGKTTTTTSTHTQSAASAGPGVAKSPPPVATPPVATAGPALVREALDAHNRERQKVGVAALAWDDELARFAADWALHLCHGGKGPAALTHRPRGPGVPGENLWEAVSSERRQYPVADAVASWAAESRFYDRRSGRCRGGVCGHYTQLVWRDSNTVGCAAASCPTSGMGATVWVCNYRPAGNVIGDKPY
jgi:hypothetical protein